MTGARPPVALAFLGRLRTDGRWGGRQHLAFRLAARHPLLYVRDSSRVPGLSGGHRVLREPGGIPTLVPFQFPLQRFGIIRRTAARSTARAIRRALGAGAGPIAAIVYPQARIDVLDALKPDLVAYHATDDFTLRNDGSDDVAYVEWESRMREVTDMALAVSLPLGERLRRDGFRDVRYLPNGYDGSLDRFAPGSPPRYLDGLPRPLLGFAGTVRAERLDIPVVRALAEAIPAATIVFVGAEYEDAAGSLASLRRISNVRFLGFRPRDAVPTYAAAFDACIVPYKDNQLNRHAFPLKVLDALALGRPVVHSPPLPCIDEFRGVVQFAAGKEEFIGAVREILSRTDTPEERQARRAAVAGLTWERVAERLEGMLGGLQAPDPATPTSTR